MEKLKNKNGITLIALVITIIVLLILTGVVLNLALGENGILKYAEIARNKHNQEKEKEKNALDDLYSSILVANDSTVTLTMEQLNAYIDKKIEENNANKCSITATSSETCTTSGSGTEYKKVNFDNIVGDTKNKFTLENGKIRVGAGVKRILVVGNAYSKCNSVAGAFIALGINLNDEQITRGDVRAAIKGSSEYFLTPPAVIYVEEGDYLSVEISSDYATNSSGCKLMIYEL